MVVWNPAAGRGREQRAEQVRRVTEALAALGHPVEVTATTRPGSAAAQAREAAEQGAEVVFACGGDGTIHEVAQGLVAEAGVPRAALAIVPLGSANALARDLRLPLDPVTAALLQAGGEFQTIPVGRLKSANGTRYFMVMAGAGPDGALVYSLQAGEKSRMGRMAYYAHAAGLFATTRFAPFEAEVTAANGTVRVRRVVSAMAVRIGSLGGLFAGLAGGGANVREARLKMILVRPPALVSLPFWFASGWMGLLQANPFVECLEAERCILRPVAGDVHAQADGEWIGAIPVEMEIVPNALRMAMCVNR